MRYLKRRKKISLCQNSKPFNVELLSKQMLISSGQCRHKLFVLAAAIVMLSGFQGRLFTLKAPRQKASIQSLILASIHFTFQGSGLKALWNSSQKFLKQRFTRTKVASIRAALPNSLQFTFSSTTSTSRWPLKITSSMSVANKTEKFALYK